MHAFGNKSVETGPKNNRSVSALGRTLMRDGLGGLAAMLVALPSAIAYGLIVYAPLGSGYAGMAAVAPCRIGRPSMR